MSPDREVQPISGAAALVLAPLTALFTLDAARVGFNEGTSMTPVFIGLELLAAVGCAVALLVFARSVRGVLAAVLALCHGAAFGAALYIDRQVSAQVAEAEDTARRMARHLGGRVKLAEGAKVSVGDRCEIAVRGFPAVETTTGWWPSISSADPTHVGPCQVVITCGGVELYGALNTGWSPECALDDQGALRVKDPWHTHKDNDPAFTLDTRAGYAEISDQGPSGAARMHLRIDVDP